MAETLPYIVESTAVQDVCHRCKILIMNGLPLKKGKTRSSGAIKLGVLVQSTTEDAQVPQWFHVECFFKKTQTATEFNIRNFAQLSNTNKHFIRRHMNCSNKQPQIVFAKKRPRESDACESIKTIVSDYRIGTTVTARCSCCFHTIPFRNVNIQKMVSGTMPVWFHAKCFAKHRLTLGWNETVKNFPGFNELSAGDREELKILFKTEMDENNNEPDAKRLKIGNLNDVNSIIDLKMKSQNQDIYKLRNQLERNLNANERVEILEENFQFVPTDPSKVLDHLADVIWFGALRNCGQCGTGSLVFDGNSSYVCNGNISSYAKCMNQVKIPERVPVEIPKTISTANAFLNKKFIRKNRAFKFPANMIESIDTRLRGLEFVIDSMLDKSKRANVQQAIVKMNGRVGHFASKSTAAIISDAKSVKAMGPYMDNAKNLGLQVVPVDFLDAVKLADPFSLIKDMNLSSWKCIDPSQRIPRNGISMQKPDDFYIDSKPKTLKWKNGFTIDADCELDDVHVYMFDRGHHYSAIMTFVDILENKNSYHRMQLLESDDEKRYWIFQKSGRIGTTIGKVDQHEYSCAEHAEKQFRTIFKDLTGNDFSPFAQFVKQPQKYQLLDIKCEARKDVLNSLVPTKLNAFKHGLMRLICDEKAMKDTMLSFDLDSANMPLGKLSKAQMDIAMNILEELTEKIQQKASDDKLIEASIRFYTMIPHTIGQSALPVINTTDQIAEKMNMLKHLANIKLTYSLLNGTDKETNPFDHLYRKLNADIEVLDRTSADYRDIEKYLQLTKGSHSNLGIVNAFEVVRHGEEERFQAFKHMQNRQLLWHGSRLTNFVGLLSNGLKIAPAEAQMCGHNFGKGIYFADCVGKSVNYCSFNGQRVGLLLLCEVAVGNSMVVKQPTNVSRLDKGIHSIKCTGQWSVSGFKKRSDGILIPDGHLTYDKTLPMGYNEFIVYDESQVRIKYLVMVRWNHVK